MYRNIGGGNCLDFTFIGPAVNLAARLEKIAATLGETIVASADFASHCPRKFTRRGKLSVAGFVAPRTVFVPGPSNEACDGAGGTLGGEIKRD